MDDSDKEDGSVNAETMELEGGKMLGDKKVRNVVVDENVKLPTNRKEAIEAVGKLKRPFINADQNKEIQVSNKAIIHSSSQDKEHNRIDVRCMGVIDRIIKNAVKIGDASVPKEEEGHTHQVEIYYCPVYLGGKQYSARMVVKQYENRGTVLEDFQLYDLATKQEKTGISSRGTGQNALTPTLNPVSDYKVIELIHSTQENDKKLLGLGENSTTKFSVGGNKGYVGYSVSRRVNAGGVQEVKDVELPRITDENKNNKDVRVQAMHAIGGNLNKLRQAMSKQRQYDQETVQLTTGFAKQLIDNGLLDGMTDSEVKQMLTKIKNATGKEDITNDVNKLVDLMVNHQVKRGKQTFEELLNTKACD